MENFFLTAAAGITALFGGNADHKLPPPNREMAKTHASSTASGANIACIAAAIAAREAALGSAVSTNTQALTSAYSERAKGLASAYAQTGNDAIRKVVKDAWAKFRASLRVAQKSWKTSQQDAWTQFKTAIKACGSSAPSLADTANAAADAVAGAGTE